MEYNWLMNELLNEFANVKQLSEHVQKNNSTLPTVVTKLFWYYGLEQRIKLPMEKFSYLYPNLLQGDLGYRLRDEYKQTLESIEKFQHLFPIFFLI
jgi:predicted transcriptional regulator